MGILSGKSSKEISASYREEGRRLFVTNKDGVHQFLDKKIEELSKHTQSLLNTVDNHSDDTQIQKAKIRLWEVHSHLTNLCILKEFLENK